MQSDRIHIDLMIAGFQKCGTSSLKAYLGQHPSILTHPQIECSFFFDDEQFRGGPSYLRKKYFSGRKFRPGQHLLAKHAVLFRNEKPLQRLKGMNPEVQIILLLRDPVERAHSSYLHQRKMDQEAHSFQEVLDRILTGSPEDLPPKWRWRRNVYLGFGCYAHYLKLIQKHFPKERTHLFLMEDLEVDPIGISQKIFERVGVDPAFCPDTSKKENPASLPRSRVMADLIRRYVHRENRMKRLLRAMFPSAFLAKSARWVKDANQKPLPKEDLGEEERERLEDFYAPWNEELERITGMELSSWNSWSRDGSAIQKGK